MQIIGILLKITVQDKIFLFSSGIVHCEHVIHPIQYIIYVKPGWNAKSLSIMLLYQLIKILMKFCGNVYNYPNCDKNVWHDHNY